MHPVLAPPATPRAVLDHLLADPAALARRLGALADPAHAAAVAARSYWHHNGFAKLVLGAESGHVLRLHVWPAGSPGDGGNPHGHCWRFASAVLLGALLDVRYAEAATGAPHARRRYAAAGALAAGSVPVRLRATGRRVRRAGERYAVDLAAVHVARPPTGATPTVTLVVQGPAAVATTVVYVAPGRPAESAPRPVTPAEVRDLADLVRAGLGSVTR